MIRVATHAASQPLRYCRLSQSRPILGNGIVAAAIDRGALRTRLNGTAKIRDISLLGHLNTAIRQAMSIVIDQREDWSTRGHETIQSLLLEDQLDQQENGAPAAVTVQSERLAIIAAAELMYPHEFRERDMREIAECATTKIALHFHVPEYVIGSSLHPGRIKIARMGWEMANR